MLAPRLRLGVATRPQPGPFWRPTNPGMARVVAPPLLLERLIGSCDLSPASVLCNLDFPWYFGEPQPTSNRHLYCSALPAWEGSKPRAIPSLVVLSRHLRSGCGRLFCDQVRSLLFFPFASVDLAV